MAARVLHQLYTYTVANDWEKLERLLRTNPDAIWSQITHNSGTVLHLAIATNQKISFLRNLLAFMSPYSLDILRKTTSEGDTALHLAASFGNLEAARLLVANDPELPNIRNQKSLLPLHEAAKSAHRKMYAYLLDLVGDDPSPFAGDQGIMLVENLITHGFCDLALRPARHFPPATRPQFLASIARHPSNFCRHANRSTTTIDRILYFFIHPKERKANKKLYNDSIGLVRFICDGFQNHALNPRYNDRSKVFFQSAAKEAARNGIHEIIQEIMITFPAALFLENDDPQISIFHIAVKHRQQSVFNLIFQMSSQRDEFLTQKDQDGNTILHIAATLPSSDRLNLIHGAALQMQQELQWYKVVEESVPASVKNSPNNEGIEPRTLFTEQHKALLKEGETWMRETAKSSTVPAALIITITFAAVISVHTATNSGTHLSLLDSPPMSPPMSSSYPPMSPPMSSSYPSQVIMFAFSDTMSLLLSIYSLLMFLSLLTARYAEYDFLQSLPSVLNRAIGALLISILSLMLTFGTVIYLVYSPGNSLWIQVFGVLGGVLVSIFMNQHSSLLNGMRGITFYPKHSYSD